MDINSIVASGMQAYRLKADTHANNVANAQTPGYERLTTSTTERPQGGVDLSVERESSPVATQGRGELPPASADDGSSTGNVSDPGSVGTPPSTSGDMVAGDAAATEAGAQSRIQSTVDSATGADLVSDMVGMNEAARGMGMLAAVYQRQDDTLGTMLDAFG